MINNTKGLYTTIIDNEHPTVIKNFVKNEFNIRRAYDYSIKELDIEDEFINGLINLGYEKLNINKIDELESNLKIQLEKLNKTEFSNSEWTKIKNDWIFKDLSYVECAKRIENQYTYTLVRDDFSQLNLKLIDKTNVNVNSVQVVQQLELSNLNKNHRYDIVILVNGLPFVQIELKKSDVNLDDAFGQVSRYRESINSYPNLMCYIRIFVISNVSQTKYFANSQKQITFKDNETKSRLNHSTKFSTYWTDSKNNRIENLFDLLGNFFTKRTILNLLIYYCILKDQKELIVMRPYQIVATEQILNRVNIAINSKNKLGTKNSGGYIWHSTGSGKTITSVKTAELIYNCFNESIKKVLFVVDRKDLDYQTYSEYESIKKGFAFSTKTTKQLENNLIDDEKPFIVTTIQKLSKFINKNPKHEIYKQEIVLIFDECHRSQFGVMHADIINKFKKYAIFGFTGTPIFNENSTKVSGSSLVNKDFNKKHNVINRTTESLFGEQLHKYNILDAIKDGSVLKFNLHEHESLINNCKNTDNSIRIEFIVNDIIKRFNHLTLRHKNSQIHKFNSILAVSSIDDAIKYYNFFKKYNVDESSLKIASIFSFNNNDLLSDLDSEFDENTDSIIELSESHKEALKQIVNDYNEIFGVSFNIENNDGFQNYYKDISKRMKNTEIDILIVVNMFLTGFDAPRLNTLWLDKNLKSHNLIQAMSRTNRVYNSIKSCGNIVSYMTPKDAIDESIALYSDGSNNVSVFITPFKETYKNYVEVANKLLEFNNLNNLFLSEEQKVEFIKLFPKFLLIREHIRVHDEEFNKCDKILTDEQLLEFQSKYNEYKNNLEQENDSSQNKQSLLNKIKLNEDIIRSYDIDTKYIINLIGNKDSYNYSEKDVLNKIYSNSKTSKYSLFILDFWKNQKNNLYVDMNVHDAFRKYCNAQIK
ncbi:MAG: HsdR family type I site-specific deoxyribonuclease, partial [Ureaplasma sp.]|nr:HsdR family type I site-specific deoxyribonuclease [Ureaplasma sp.]